MSVRHPRLSVVCLCLLLWTIPAVRAAEESVELVRDTWGIPHVFAESDAGAWYGLGYATAEDRGFQMVFNLRIMQGRLAEIAGQAARAGRSETAVDSDRKMRTLGFYRAARRVADGLDAETRTLLEAYCAGVNAFYAAHPDQRLYLFAERDIEPEPWTPADCLAVWWHIAQFFGPDGTRDLVASRGAGAAGRRGGRGATDGQPPPGEEEAAVVLRSDVSDAWLAEVRRFQQQHGLAGPSAASAAEGPKFSHAWVVGGAKLSSGSSALVSDPQTMVGNPSLFYEFHVRGKTFNARGIGVPGSPVLLIGFTDRVAWGMTALGADQADLFHLDTDAQHPDQYRFEGRWQDMDVTEEAIQVRGGAAQTVRCRETQFGPVVTDYVFARPEDGEFALQRVPLCERERETIQGALAMLRAADAEEFAQALEGWRFPSANVVFGDRQGQIGYWLLGALPVRSPRAAAEGRFPHDGSRADSDWQGMIPHALKPHLLNPARGYVFSANHRPVGSFYPLYIGHSTGSQGDTLRSWRLRERISARQQFTPEEVLAIHHDQVNPARRDLLRIGYHLRDALQADLSQGTRRALEYLEPWYRSGAASDLHVRGTELALEINTLFRIMSTDLAVQFGGGESGLSLWLKTVTGRLDRDGQAEILPLERAYVDTLLQNAWQTAESKYGRDPQRWAARAAEAVRQRRLGYFQNLNGFPSLDPQHDLLTPELACVDGATIRSQASQAYTQFVPLHNVDAALSLLPVGVSERPDHPSRLAALPLWEAGQLHAAPLSREAVDRIEASRTVLMRRP